MRMGAATAQVHIEQPNNVVDLMSLNCFAGKKATIILHINQADKINYGEFTRTRSRVRRNEDRHLVCVRWNTKRLNAQNEFQWCYHKHWYDHVVSSRTLSPKSVIISLTRFSTNVDTGGAEIDEKEKNEKKNEKKKPVYFWVAHNLSHLSLRNLLNLI